MKIFSVLHNYGGSDAELLSSPFGQGETDWFEIPDSALLRSGNPFFIPEFDSGFAIFPSIAFRIGRLGKNIAPRFAERYLKEFTMAFCVVGLDSLAQLRAEGKPWCRAVAFDRCCWLGNLQPFDALFDYGNFEIRCADKSYSYSPGNLLCSPAEILSLLSQNNTLKIGDFILAGLTPGGIPIEIGSSLHASAPKLNCNFIDINIR